MTLPLIEKARRYLVAQCKGNILDATAIAAMTTALLTHRAGEDIEVVIASIREAHDEIGRRVPGGAA